VKPSAQPDAAEHERYVFRELVRCPACDGIKHRVYGHGKPQDGTKEQYARCLNPKCGHQFKIIWE